jgi:signal transduction histidine kinase
MTIGAYCIMDDKPRSGVSSEEKLFMSSMANTVFQHLEALRIKTEFQRRDKLVSGLESFVGGLSTLSGPQDEPVMATRNDPAQDVGPPGPDSHGYFPMVEDADDANSPSPAAMWELALPTGCKSMFSRAATILRQASDYDGVTFFYIPASGNAIPSSRSHIQPSSVAHGVPTPPSTFGVATPTGLPESLAQSDSTSADENTWSDGNSSNEPCPYLGSSAGPAGKPEHEDHPTHNYNFSERDLQRVMGSRPRAEVFLLDRTGKIMPGDTSSSGSGTEIPPAFPESTSVSQGPGSRKKKTRASRVKALRKIHPKARSFVCLPLWDYTRQRWFAFVVCWIVKPTRDPVVDGDLNFLKIFGNSITNTLSHLDALDVDRAKTSFVSSISHELRSPLHGVLGATNFLNDSGLSPFQSEMVDSITTCGRTLLQTLEHVMDFTKINDFSKNPSKHAMANIKGRKHDRSQTLKTLPESSLMSSVNMSVLVEEVVESTMMGFTVQHDFLHAEDGGTPKITGNLKKVANARRSLYRRGRTRVILKVPSNKQWYFDTQAGAWRRIIMNLVGNALKYTAKGLIEVSLEARDLEQQPGDTENNEDCATLVLTVKDTGIGMSPYFMQNQLYKPFSQENSFAPGTGLGLSIVRQVVDSLGGQVNVSSKKGTGTTITVAIECKRSEKQEPEHEKPTSVSSVARRMQGLHVCVLEDVKSRGSKDNSSAFLQAEETFSASLLTTLRAWFGMNMTVQASVPRDADLVICLEPSFRQLEAIRLQFPDRSAPPTLFIAHDVLEMAVLRADARVVSQESIVEITYQP